MKTKGKTLQLTRRKLRSREKRSGSWDMKRDKMLGRCCRRYAGEGRAT